MTPTLAPPPSLSRLNVEVRHLLRAALAAGLITRTAIMQAARADWTTLNHFLGGGDLTRQDVLVRLRNAALPVAAGSAITLRLAETGWSAGYEYIRPSVERKLEAEFDCCSLLPPTWAGDLAAVRSAVGSVSPAYTHQFQGMDHIERVVRAALLPAGEFGRLRRMHGPIRVSVPAIEVGSVAALRKMSDDWDLRIDLDAVAPNGAEQMRRVHDGGVSGRFDFAVFGVAAAALGMRPGSEAAAYWLLCPVHSIRQCVLGLSPHLADLREVIACDGGFAVMQAQSRDRTLAGTLPPAVKRVYLRGVTNPLSATAHVGDGVVLITYEPVASTLRGVADRPDDRAGHGVLDPHRPVRAPPAAETATAGRGGRPVCRGVRQQLPLPPVEPRCGDRPVHDRRCHHSGRLRPSRRGPPAATPGGPGGYPDGVNY